jgi:hypothetical protein
MAPAAVHRVTGDGTPISRDMALSHGGISAGRPGNAPNGQPTRGQSPRNQFPQGQFQQGQSPQGQQRGPQGYTQQGRPDSYRSNGENGSGGRPPAGSTATPTVPTQGYAPHGSAAQQGSNPQSTRSQIPGSVSSPRPSTQATPSGTGWRPQYGNTPHPQRPSKAIPSLRSVGSQTYQQPAQHHAADGDATRTRPQTPARATPAPQQRQDHPRPDNR